MTDGMHFILVPFLLGVRLPDDYYRWQNGPEYTFNATVATLSNLSSDEHGHRGSSLSITMKCQPKEPDRLRCHYENSTITKLLAREYRPEAAVPLANATYKKFGFGNVTFEIKFNGEGIEEYMFENYNDRPVPYYLMNMYRLVANQLSVWSGVSKPSDVEKRLENTTVGNCLVEYKVSRRKWEKQEGRGFRLAWFPNEAMNLEEVTEVEKEIQLNECIPHPVYRAETMHIFDVVPMEPILKLRTSTARMFISSTNFTSESFNEIDVYDYRRERIGSAFNHVRLSLTSVDPAHSGPKEMSNSTTAGPVLY